MIASVLWICGFTMTGVAVALYLATWFVITRWPSKVLLGGVESQWLKFLLRAAYVGLLIVLVGVVDAVVIDLLASTRRL